MSTLRSFCRLHGDFIPILVLFVAFRVMALLLYKPGGYIFGWNDYYFFRDWASYSNQGLYPYLNFWMEHPPLFPWFGVLVYKVSLLAPVWTDNLLWFSLTFGLALLPFEVGNLVLVYAMVSSITDRTAAIRAAWIYSALYLPVFFWTAGFDCYPLFFLLLSVYLGIKNRPALAGLATGLGFMVKVVPAIAGPVLLMAMLARTRSKALAYSLAAGATVLLVSVPFVIANPTMFSASFLNMLARSSWETVWALLDGYYGSGRGVASMEMRLDPATATVTHHSSNLPWTGITVAFAVVFVFLITRKTDWRQPRKLAALAALALNFFILYSKGYSPQFVVYPLAFIIIIFPNWRGVVYSLLLSAINVAEYPFALIFLDELEWLVAGTVVLRTILILALSVEYLAVVFDGLLARAARFALPATASVTSLALIGFSVAGFGQYFDRSLSSSMFREPIEFLREQPPATVMFVTNEDFEQFYPFLRDRQQALVFDGMGSLNEDSLRGNIWLVYLGSAKDKEKSPAVEKWLAEKTFPLSTTFLTNARLSLYSAASLQRQDVAVTFGELARLSAYATDPAATHGEVLHVSLLWKGREKTERSFKVFLHLVDRQGQVVAQHDAEPVAGLRPTRSWSKGEEIQDNHGIVLPDALPPGLYHLVVGLYDAASGARLATDTGSDRYVLGTVTVESSKGKKDSASGGR